MIEIEQRLITQQTLDKCVKIKTNLWEDKKYTIPIYWLLSGEDDKIYFLSGVVSSYLIKNRK